MKLATVIYIPSRSESLSYRFYQEPIKGYTLLDWLLDWLITSASDWGPYLICDHDPEGDRLSEHARRHGLPAFSSPYRTQLQSLVAFLEAAGCDHLCTVPFGAPLGPSDLAQHIWQHHLANNNDYTEVAGLPHEVAPCIYSRALVTTAAMLELGRFPGQLQQIVQSMLSLQEVGEKLPIFLKAEPFDAIEKYCIDPEQLPPTVELTQPKAISVARSILNELPSSQSNGPIDNLILYKKRLLEDRQRQYKMLQSKLADMPFANFERCPRDRPRILFISQCSAYSGAEDSFCRLISAIDPSRYEKHALVALEGLLAQRLREAGAKVICPNAEFGAASAYNTLFLMNVYREVQPDIVHQNDPIGPNSTICAALTNVPLIQHVRVKKASLFGEAFAVAKSFIAVSKFVRSKLANTNVDPERLQVVYDGIDVDQFHKDAFITAQVREELGIPQESKVILMIARLAKYKRHDLFLEAVSVVRQSVPSLRILLVGESFPPEARTADQVKQLTGQLGLEDVVTFLPFQEDIRKVELAADIQVLCSDGDPLGTCILESMALEVPVVVTNSGGLTEIVEDGISGFIVPSGDAHLLAEKMLQLLSNNELRHSMGRAARQRILACATTEICARQVMNLYETILHN